LKSEVQFKFWSKLLVIFCKLKESQRETAFCHFEELPVRLFRGQLFLGVSSFHFEPPNRGIFILRVEKYILKIYDQSADGPHFLHLYNLMQ